MRLEQLKRIETLVHTQEYLTELLLRELQPEIEAQEKQRDSDYQTGYYEEIEDEKASIDEEEDVERSIFDDRRDLKLEIDKLEEHLVHLRRKLKATYEDTPLQGETDPIESRWGKFSG